MTITEYKYSFLDGELYTEIEKLEKFRNVDASGNIIGKQCSTFLDCSDCPADSINKTSRFLVESDKLIMVLEPFKLLEFDVLGQNVKAFIGSKCYATSPGKDDVCEVNMDAEIIGAKIPIVPTQTVFCKISKLAKKFQFFRKNIE